MREFPAEKATNKQIDLKNSQEFPHWDRILWEFGVFFTQKTLTGDGR